MIINCLYIYCITLSENTKTTRASGFCVFAVQNYLFPPMSRPGFRRETMSLFEYFFGERVF